MEEPTTRRRLPAGASAGHPKRPAVTLFRHHDPLAPAPLVRARWLNRVRHNRPTRLYERFHWLMPSWWVLARRHGRNVMRVERFACGYASVFGIPF